MTNKYLSWCLVGSMLLVLALVIGCGPTTVYFDKTTGEVIQPDYEVIDIQGYLPPRAKEVEKLGNYWFTFELQTGEVNRKFLVRKHFGSQGETGVVITELNLTNPCTCGTMCETKGMKHVESEGPGLVP